MAKLISTILAWGFFLGITGGLVDVTRAMFDKAVQAHKLGIISLGKLSRSLNR